MPRRQRRQLSLYWPSRRHSERTALPDPAGFAPRIAPKGRLHDNRNKRNPVPLPPACARPGPPAPSQVREEPRSWNPTPVPAPAPVAGRFLVEVPRTDRPIARHQLHQSELSQTGKAVRCGRFTKPRPAAAVSGPGSPFGSGRGLAGYHSTRTTSPGPVLCDSTPLSVTTSPSGVCRERGTGCESPSPHRTRWPGGPPGPSGFGVGSCCRRRLRRTAAPGSPWKCRRRIPGRYHVDRPALRWGAAGRVATLALAGFSVGTGGWAEWCGLVISCSWGELRQQGRTAG